MQQSGHSALFNKTVSAPNAVTQARSPSGCSELQSLRERVPRKRCHTDWSNGQRDVGEPFGLGSQRDVQINAAMANQGCRRIASSSTVRDTPKRFRTVGGLAGCGGGTGAGSGTSEETSSVCLRCEATKLCVRRCLGINAHRLKSVGKSDSHFQTAALYFVSMCGS